MKKIKKKGILQKTIIVILMVLTLNFIVPTYSSAGIGGVLMDPIVDLFCTLGDAVINLLQKCMTGKTDDFRLFNGGYLVESTTFFSDSTYSDKWTNATGERITPYSQDNGFNKTLLFSETQDFHIPVATYSPEKIFAGKVQGLDINFIDPDTDMDGDNRVDVDAHGNYINTAKSLQPTIAKWYVALRNLTIVGLLSVLVYVGIRIVISSTASDKAKYKQMLVDWLIALCLVFFLHYIMSFTITLTQSICNAIAGSGDETVVLTVVQQDGSTRSFETNLLGSARFKTQYDDFGPKMTYLIMYLALVIYTCIFTFFYLKRLLMMAFLTIIAPVVALTYPIDKISDGKSQAFDMWLKEYIFNALIQPFHLIIYTVLVGSAMDLASTNIIYMIAALAFMMPAEKILRKFFGFEKAGAGTLGGLVGAAALGSMAKKAISGKGGAGGKGGSGKQKEEGEKPPRFERRHDVSEIEGPEGLNENGDDANSLEDSNIHDRAAEMLAEETSQMSSQDYRESGMSPQEYRETRQRELEEQLRREQEAQAQTQEQEEENKKKGSFVSNWRNAHNINWGSAGRLVGRGIAGTTKFATKTAFKAGAGTLAGAVAIASGGGLAGGAAAFATGAAVGGKLGNAAVKVGSKAVDGVGRTLGAAGVFAKEGAKVAIDARKQGDTRINATISGVGAAFGSIKDKDVRTAATDRLLGGTALGREIDLGMGNTRFQDAGGAREIKENKDKQQYVRDYLTAKNGVVPSAKEVKNTMNSLDPYIAEGLTEIKDMLKAQKAEAYVGSKQAAIIAKLGQEKGITAEVLNDEKKAKAQQANLMQDFINKGNSKADASKLAEHTMNVLKVQQGVAHNMKKPEKSSKK